METKANYFSAGLFIIASVCAITFFLLWMGQKKWSHHPTYDIYFSNSVTGLRVNEVVSYNGVPIGKVVDINVDLNIENRVHVIVEIRRPELIRQNSYAILESKGITGTLQVRILGGTKNDPILETHHIPSKPSSIQSMMDQTPIILEKISVLLENNNLAAITQTLKQLEIFTQNLGTHSAQTTQLFKKISGVLDETQSILKENKKPILQFTTQGLQNTNELITELRDLIKNFDSLPKNRKGEMVPP